MFVIDSDWFGKKLNYHLAFELEKHGDRIYFAVNSDYRPIHSSRCRGFSEGLWNFDVAEFFLKTGPTSYLECNLAPHGAWWAMHFDSYRKRSASQPRIELNTVNYCKDFFSVSAEFTVTCLEQGALEGNICAILERDTYITLHSPPARLKPDFHLDDLFSRLEEIGSKDHALKRAAIKNSAAKGTNF